LNKVIFVVGPTASGKTELSINLAKKINGEIISADSMQAYKGMDIISQAPPRTEQKEVKHHCISFLRAREEYSAALFSKKAEKKNSRPAETRENADRDRGKRALREGAP